MSELAEEILKYRQQLHRTSFHLTFGESDLHPINSLRNIAVDACESDFSFLVDVDLVPNPGTPPGTLAM